MAIYLNLSVCLLTKSYRRGTIRMESNPKGRKSHENKEDPLARAGVGAPAPAPAPEVAPAPMEIVSTKAQYGDADLDKVKSMALSDLRPILEKVDIAPEKKFMIYKDIIDLTEDKACIEPAYNSARLIADEKAKGEALVFIVECIDKLGIQMTIGGESDAA